MYFVINNFREQYPHIAKTVLDQGRVVSPRGMKTREVMGAVIRLTNVLDVLPTGTGRGLVPAIGVAEALQLIGGFSDPEAMVKIAPAFARFQGGDGSFHGAYGHRIRLKDGRHQAGLAIQRLKDDPASRQAVITLWRPELDLARQGEKDYPCTVTLMFAIRGGELHMTTAMRSNDVWLGLPYDVFQFTQLQQTMAYCLGIDCGDYTHFAASLHVYEEHFGAVEGLAPSPERSGLPLHGITSGSPDPRWVDFEHEAVRLFRGNSTSQLNRSHARILEAAMK